MFVVLACVALGMKLAEGPRHGPVVFCAPAHIPAWIMMMQTFSCPLHDNMMLVGSAITCGLYGYLLAEWPRRVTLLGIVAFHLTCILIFMAMQGIPLGSIWS